MSVAPDARNASVSRRRAMVRRRLRSASLTRQFVIVAVAMVLATACAVGLIVYLALQAALDPYARVRVVEDVARFAEVLELRTRGVARDLKAMKGAGPLTRYVAAQTEAGDGDEAALWRTVLEEQFAASVAAKADYRQLRLIRADGVEVVRVDRGEGEEPPRVAAPGELQNKRAREYVAAALGAEGGGLFVSTVDLNREHGQIEHPRVPVLRVAIPVDAADGTRWGIFIANLDMGERLERMRQAAPPDGSLFVVNADGDFLLHPDPQLEFAFEFGEPIRLAGNQPEIAEALAARVLNADGANGWIELNGQTVAAATAYLAGFTPVTVIQSVAQASAVAEAAVRRSALLGATVAALVAALIAALLARLVAAPIAAVTQSVRSGRPKGLPVRHAGEVGELSRAIIKYMDQERRHRAIIDSSSEAIIMVQPDGRVTLWNSGAERLFARTAAAALDGTLDDVVPAVSATELRALVNRVLMGKVDNGPLDLSLAPTLDGRRDVEMRVSPVYGEDGTVIAASIMARDVTTERTAMEMFQIAVEHSPAGLLLLDRTGRVVRVNAEVERRFGVRRDDLIGQHFAGLIPPEARLKMTRLFNKYLDAPRRLPMGFTRSFEALRDDGTTFPVELGLTPIPHGSGTAILAAVVDVSSQMAVKAELEDRTQRLERSNTDLEQFAYVASHDLKEPLRTVASFTQLLATRYRGEIDERADTYIHHIVDGTARMQALIADLLIYSRVAKGAVRVEAVDLNVIVHDVIRLLATWIEEAEAVIEVAAPLPRVLGDPKQIERVVQNLLSNAIKFRAETPPHIVVAAERLGTHWQLSVKDNGIGFPSEAADHIFQMFKRLHPVGTYGGTGLGLAICKRIVNESGGEIWAKSAPGYGSTFFFTLPAA